ncbi:hypothetical protein niasHS_002490 [Heterodera schachtii]|uniref:CAAX prenyl protease 2 n=1 Tax=Heterodera schachtii TaxID=97005 RepID=A0ABD2KK49_HETSC
MQECLIYVGSAILMPLSYVGFIYAFDNRQHSRDYLPNVRRRFLAAMLNNMLVVPSTYFLLRFHYPNPFSQMGFRPKEHLNAIVFPAFLTLIFYSGTFLMYLMNGTLNQIFEFSSWRSSFSDILWIRCAIAAPITEELTFRAGSAALFRHCLGTKFATFISPITFSLSHFHHIFEDRKQGLVLRESLATRSFQMLYTYLFGLYATHIFFTTGNILAPIVTHSLCNVFGFPPIEDISLFSSRRIRYFFDWDELAFPPNVPKREWVPLRSFVPSLCPPFPFGQIFFRPPPSHLSPLLD